MRWGNLYWASRTHCKWGHEYTPANTKIHKDGHRLCKQCRRDYRRDHYERSKAWGKDHESDRTSTLTNANKSKTYKTVAEDQSHDPNCQSHPAL